MKRFGDTLHGEWVLKEKNELNLDPQQQKQAETHRSSSEAAVVARLPEAYQWLLVPDQKGSPTAPVEWQVFRLSGQDPLAVRASKKLRNEELLIPLLAGTRLRMELDRVPLWRGDHVSIKQLADDFPRYVYLPRLTGSDVLVDAIQDGLGLLLWQQESFAYADRFDEATGRYIGLRAGHQTAITPDPILGLLVKPSIAIKQMTADQAAAGVSAGSRDSAEPPGVALPDGTPAKPQPQMPSRFYGTVQLDPMRVGRDASRIADEVISHLQGLTGVEVKVMLDIEASVPGGASETVVRTVTENARTLKFTRQGFESD